MRKTVSLKSLRPLFGVEGGPPTTLKFFFFLKHKNKQLFFKQEVE